MAWALNLSLDVELLAPGLRICILVLCGCSTCLIASSMDIGQEVTKQGFPLDVLDKLMVCEVNEPSGVVLTLELK